jgi:hypothetical protein
MQWRCIVQTATIAGRGHHWQFSSQELPHWANCKDRMLFVRPQTDCSAQRRSHIMTQVVSPRSFLAEAWFRFQLSFYGNRGNQSINSIKLSAHAGPRTGRQVCSMFSGGRREPSEASRELTSVRDHEFGNPWASTLTLTSPHPLRIVLVKLNSFVWINCTLNRGCNVNSAVKQVHVEPFSV